jgi:hypothetical protein
MQRAATISVRALVALLFAFLALSLADLYLTWKLMHQGGERIRESNPFAAAWLAQYGWWGMTVFKLGAVAVVAGLVTIIARRRPRTAEGILIFACGVLSTVVVHSIFLGWSGASQAEHPMEITDTARWTNAPENELFALLSLRPVQEDLHLSEAKVSEISELSLTHHTKTRDGAMAGREAWNTAVTEALAERRAWLDALEPGQVERLQQIGLQRRGVDAFAAADVQERLALTAKQVDKIRDILAAPPLPPPGRFIRSRDNNHVEMMRPPEDMPARTMNHVLAVLTPDQLARWKEMIGKPFRDEPRFGFGGPPGPWRDARTPR